MKAYAGCEAAPLLAAAVFLAIACQRRAVSGSDDVDADVRPPAVAGAFYPEDPDALRKTIQGFLDNAGDVNVEGEVIAALAPHAGYVYSGQIAACAFKAMQDAEFDTLVVIGHDAHMPGTVAFVNAADYYQTPLGRVAVDVEMVQKLLDANKGIREHEAFHAREHTVEVQLPFLQVMGKQFSVVPVLFGNPTRENCRAFADALEAAAGDRKLFILASTDMCHYPPADVSAQIDQRTLDILKAMDIAKLFDHLESPGLRAPNLETTMCARGGVGTAILYAADHGATGVDVLRYGNSGDVPAADKRRVVGYGAAVFTVPSAPRK